MVGTLKLVEFFNREFLFFGFKSWRVHFSNYFFMFYKFDVEYPIKHTERIHVFKREVANFHHLTVVDLLSFSSFHHLCCKLKLLLFDRLRLRTISILKFLDSCTPTTLLGADHTYKDKDNPWSCFCYFLRFVDEWMMMFVTIAFWFIVVVWIS